MSFWRRPKNRNYGEKFGVKEQIPILKWLIHAKTVVIHVLQSILVPQRGDCVFKSYLHGLIEHHMILVHISADYRNLPVSVKQNYEQ